MESPRVAVFFFVASKAPGRIQDFCEGGQLRSLENFHF